MESVVEIGSAVDTVEIEIVFVCRTREKGGV
jgi:hypothetical protein